MMTCKRYQIKVITEPIHSWEATIEELCFLFPYGKGKGGLFVNEQSCFFAATPNERLRKATQMDSIKVSDETARDVLILTLSLQKKTELHPKLKKFLGQKKFKKAPESKHVVQFDLELTPWSSTV